VEEYVIRLWFNGRFSRYLLDGRYVLELLAWGLYTDIDLHISITLECSPVVNKMNECKRTKIPM